MSNHKYVTKEVAIAAGYSAIREIPMMVEAMKARDKAQALREQIEIEKLFKLDDEE